MPDPTLTPDTPLAEIPGIPARQRAGLKKLELESVAGLLAYYPRRHEDRRQFDKFPLDECDHPLCLHGRVTDTKVRYAGRRRRFFEIEFQEASPDAFSPVLTCRWFNLRFVHKVIAVDQELVIFGKPKRKGQRLIIDQPEFEILDPDASGASVHMQRIVPVYPLVDGVSQKPLRALLHRILDELPAGVMPDTFDPAKTDEFAGMSRDAAIRQAHFPDNFDALGQARRFLALDEFFALQLNVLRRRSAIVTSPGAAHCGDGGLWEKFLAALEFDPTGAQLRAVDEIRADLAADRPMNRLLQGDVGSGKTLVALAAILLAVESGCQAALMAPTQILAEQHYLNFQRWLDPLGVRVGLRTASRKEDGFLPLFSEGTGEEPQVLIGTHALLYDKVAFSHLGLAVIDEQHKFGVLQRARLIGQAETTPDVLVMTATPIPRTLTLTVYGDLDVSIIDEMPAGRGKIVTAVRDLKKTPDAAKFVAEQLDAGRQAYIVYPLIEDSDKLNLKAATTEFEAWNERLAPRQCALIHGRIPGEEKEHIMRRFREGDTGALVATTVIEVGVDVPNANVMLIFNAERFGLAQLHQLRGRIGRGAHKSYCVLMADTKADGAAEKLAVLEKTRDGFEIAEADLRMRGPGDILGTAQSGLPPLRLGDLIRDVDLVHTARALAAEVIDADPELKAPNHTSLRGLLVEEIANLSQVS